ncbi:DegV family protein [Clostridium paraputrificum]|uniref:DegV family protein n=1 Tax=Clostridium TaxID=1485 RepID=UPI003D3594E9
MMDFIIMADSACDLPKSLIEENNICYVGLTCLFKGKEYVEDHGDSLPYEDFYKGIREGEMPSTSQVNSLTYYDLFEGYIKKNKAILYLAFSSALSGTINSARLAKNDILDKYPNADITILDTKSASLGYGLLVLKACKLRIDGMSKNDISKIIEETSPKLNHIVAMDDLDYLKRGGRLSGTAATLGTILQLKPMVKINDEGQLINYGKVKGRKKSITTLFKEFEARAIDIPSQDLIAISHSDCLKDAQLLADMIKEKYNVKILINSIGCVIGSHTGANTIALFFLGNSR